MVHRIVKDTIAARHLLIAYIIFSIAIIVGFIYLQSLADELEKEGLERASELCQTNNEMKTVLDSVLVSLVAPREDDEPGEQEERERLYEDLEPLLEQDECPPPPPS